MTKKNNPVLLGQDHFEKTARLLEAYCINACVYFGDFHALLGSAVAMRKALELMGAYLLFHFSKNTFLSKMAVMFSMEDIILNSAYLSFFFVCK